MKSFNYINIKQLHNHNSICFVQNYTNELIFKSLPSYNSKQKK